MTETAQRGIPDAARHGTRVILRAISDPSSMLPRLSGEWGTEPLPEWQTRAVLAALAASECPVCQPGYDGPCPYDE